MYEPWDYREFERRAAAAGAAERVERSIDASSCALTEDAAMRGQLAAWLAEKFGRGDVWLMTWTFDDKKVPVTESLTTSVLLRGARWLERRMEARGSSFYSSVERGSLRGRLHIHTISDDSSLELDRKWAERFGFVKRKGPVESREGVSLYVTKYATKARGDVWQPVMAGGPRFFGQTETLR